MLNDLCKNTRMCLHGAIMTWGHSSTYIKLILTFPFHLFIKQRTKWSPSMQLWWNRIWTNSWLPSKFEPINQVTWWSQIVMIPKKKEVANLHKFSQIQFGNKEGSIYLKSFGCSGKPQGRSLPSPSSIISFLWASYLVLYLVSNL
jgi:hypothetical protein